MQQTEINQELTRHAKIQQNLRVVQTTIYIYPSLDDARTTEG